MKNLRAKSGPLKERPFFKPEEIEDICLSELKKFNLLPSEPSPIRIERFIEKKFGITPTYTEMNEGILGFTKFSEKGVEEIFIAKSLDEEGTEVSNRRLRTTLAHEAGHGLLHTHLFVLGAKSRDLFDADQPAEPKILCRDISGVASASKKYDGRWWEFQANKAMTALLLPKILVRKLVEPMIKSKGLLGGEVLESSKRAEAITVVSDVFDVNPIVARFRLEELYPLTDSFQLCL